MLKLRCHALCRTHLEQGVEEYLCQRLWHSQVAVTGADLKGRLQTLYRYCRGASVKYDRVVDYRTLVIKTELKLSCTPSILHDTHHRTYCTSDRTLTSSHL